jgi:hypothetical protein
MNSKRAILELFLVRALGLFVELMFIRWVASEVRMFAFYKNFALIAAFLGLGVGFAVHHHSSSVNWFERFYFPLVIIVTTLVLLWGRTWIGEHILLNAPNPQDFTWADFALPETVWLTSIIFYSAMLTVFIILTIMFIPLGQLTASKFVAFQPLRA